VRAGFECLKEDVEDVMGLLSEIILTPALPQQKIDIVKAQVRCLLLVNPCFYEFIASIFLQACQ
jgi:hypothetical protein